MVKKERISELNKKPVGNGAVLYIMERDMRVLDNWALLHAQEVALERKVPLIVLYFLYEKVIGTSTRHVSFVLGALSELQESLRACGIPLVVLHSQMPGKEGALFCSEHGIGYVVTDYSPLRQSVAWKNTLARALEVSMVSVDAHNIVPVTVSSNKAEVGARTLRPKMYKLLPQYLEEFPRLEAHPYKSTIMGTDIQPDKLKEEMQTDDTISLLPVAPGERSAGRRMQEFIESGLSQYALGRNDAVLDAQSGLSPFLHFGMIAPARVTLTVLESVGMNIGALLYEKKNASTVQVSGTSSIEGARAFLEELIVRRELSDNFCHYVKSYDSVDGFSAWAKKSLFAHAKDKRPYLYSKKQLEEGKTHDELWNAAQHQLVCEGKIHGYMRMYWAKKILEWSPSAEDAMKIAIHLNDTYSLDGRDPNGYTGIAWSIGGVHDRPWFNRPIFGLVRYMARSGCEKQFDVKAYIRKHS
jgi:deoxyribodipyrimidine photo-lyase